MRTNKMKLLYNSAYPNYTETLIESGGTFIALSIYESSKENPSVIFIPGTMTHPLFYDEFLCLLAENHFNVIGVHPVSHGKSPREKSIYTFSDMLENVRDTITYCLERYTDEIFVMGSSQGGILTIAAAGIDDRIKAVFPHNILLPSLRDSIQITRFPETFKPLYEVIPAAMRLGARLSPKLQIPITSYLDFQRITRSSEIKERFYQDPIGLTQYPLAFLSSLFSADLSSITNGSIKCPVVVIASKKDTLFPYDYCCQVFDLIKAPEKEMLVFDEPYHLILNEAFEAVTGPVVEKLNKYCNRSKLDEKYQLDTAKAGVESP